MSIGGGWDCQATGDEQDGCGASSETSFEAAMERAATTAEGYAAGDARRVSPGDEEDGEMSG